MDALSEAQEMLRTTGPLLTQPIPSSVGPYRRELLETRRVLDAVVRELEAARAVVKAAKVMAVACTAATLEEEHAEMALWHALGDYNSLAVRGEKAGE
jgi:hypothetical protein